MLQVNFLTIRFQLPAQQKKLTQSYVTTWSLRLRMPDSNPIFVASSMPVRRSPAHRIFIWSTYHLGNSTHFKCTQVSHSSRFSRDGPRLLGGFKQRCPCVPQNSVRDDEMPRILTCYKNTTFMSNCKKLFTSIRLEKTSTVVGQPSTSH